MMIFSFFVVPESPSYQLPLTIFQLHNFKSKIISAFRTQIKFRKKGEKLFGYALFLFDGVWGVFVSFGSFLFP